MNGCNACLVAAHGGSTTGLAHTCYGSGTYLAAEAHSSGEIMEMAKSWPIFEVNMKFVVQATDEHMVREKLNPLVNGLLNDDLTQWGDFTVTEREGIEA